MAIERDIKDVRSIRAADTSEKRKEDQPSSSSGKRQKTSTPRVFQGRGRLSEPRPDWGFYPAKTDDMLFLPSA